MNRIGPCASASLAYSRAVSGALAVVGAKCVAQPDEPSAFERNDVEPASRREIAATRDAADKNMLSRTQQPLPFVPADARGGAAVAAPRTRAHFDEHERAVAIAHHEVDLAAATRHVARDEA